MEHGLEPLGGRHCEHSPGGVDALAAQCETVSAWHRNNDLPLLWPIHARHRALLFRLIDLLELPGAGEFVSGTLWVVRTPYRLLKGAMNKVLVPGLKLKRKGFRSP